MSMRRTPYLAVFILLSLVCASAENKAGHDTTLLDSLVTAKSKQGEIDFERLVAQRIQADNLDDTHARIAAHRELAAAFASRERWMDAVSQIGNALRVARSLGEPDLLISLYLQVANYLHRAGSTDQALADLDAADAMIQKLGKTSERIVSSLLRAAVLARSVPTYDQSDRIYAELLADPQTDHYQVLLERARETREDRVPVFAPRWEEVFHAATTREDVAVQTEARNQLGYAAASLKNYVAAAAYFAAAEDNDTPSKRNSAQWLAIIAAYSAANEYQRARHAIDTATSLCDEEQNPGLAADLHEAKGDLLGREGDYAAALSELQRANALRRRRNANRQVIPFAKLTPMVSSRATESAAELAAVRNALREVELERARLRANQVAGIATVAVLLAALLGLGYAYKRRTAAALASARDNAELRADRTHWQMLRYQLNPHFLFNALSSLGGLVATNPPAAGRVVERLSEFCQLALKGANDDLRTLAHELAAIRAYLDVEQAGAGDALTARIEATSDAQRCLVPALLLQPLVENALKYGSQTSEERLDILISARRSDDGAILEIEVSNTGRWVEHRTELRTRDAIGVTNVRERLARLGDQSADLTFTHDELCVRALVRLPARPGPTQTPVS